MNNYTIYMHKNKLNGKIYIGQSINIEERWKAHRAAGQNNNCKYKDYPLYKDMHKYKLDNFDFSIVEKCLKEENISNSYFNIIFVYFCNIGK